jgi:hypothetical protein
MSAVNVIRMYILFREWIVLVVVVKCRCCGRRSLLELDFNANNLPKSPSYTACFIKKHMKKTFVVVDIMTVNSFVFSG